VLIGSHIYAASIGTTRITLSDLEWPFDASRAVSAVAEFLVNLCELLRAPKAHCCTLMMVMIPLKLNSAVYTSLFQAD